MRPFKHVARQSGTGEPDRYQNILGIDVATFSSPWGDVPIVATSEMGRITLYYWNDVDRRWALFEREHMPLSIDGITPDDPNGWNWSERVAVACSSTTVYLVYKRYPFGTGISRETLVLERYEPEPGTPNAPLHRLRFVDATDLCGSGIQAGRGLWAECDESRQELLILCQTRGGGIGGIGGVRFPSGWKLTLIRYRVNAAGDASADSADIDDGGYDLDARRSGSSLVVVYRRTPEAFRVPMIELIGAGLHLTSGSDADPFYEPLRLATIDLATAGKTIESLAGGEHPQIHRLDPLLVTMERPSHLDLALDTPILPLPPRRPHAIWMDGKTDKVAFLRDGGQTFRGVLLTADARTIPRSHAGIDSATNLFENRGGLLVHSSPFRFFPVHVLAMARERKGITLDLLHHRQKIGLFRSRLRLALSDGTLSVTDRAFEVWDIGHAQIGDPDALAPSADGETRQFEPFGGLSVSRATDVDILAVLADNTIGGHLAAETTRDPVAFFAYSDLGDGGLRAIFAPDIPALADPPPIGNAKALRPEQVTGPHLPCDEWITLRAEGFVASELIGYPVGLIDTGRSLGSSLEVPIDFLLDACVLMTADHSGPGGAPLDPMAGLTKPQLAAVDTRRAGFSAPLPIEMTASDGRAITVTVSPGGLIAGVSLSCAAEVGGATPPVGWTFALLDTTLPFAIPPGPILPGALAAPAILLIAQGNPAAITFATDGVWRLSVFLPDPAGGPPIGASVDLNVLPSTYGMVTALYDGVSSGDLYQIGDMDLTALQYGVTYVADDQGEVASVRILSLPQRATELRFGAGEAAQGIVECREVITFSTEQMKLRMGLDLLFHVKKFSLTLRYGRGFTPGMLMSDQRSRNVLDGDLITGDASQTIGRDDALRHAAIGAKPATDTRISRISDHDLDIEVEVWPLSAGISALVAGLLVLGLSSLAQTILAISGAVIAATALGPIGLVAAAAAAVALAVILVVVVPPAVESVVKEKIGEKIDSGDIKDQLDAEPLIRYAGEGASEALARKTLDAARALGFDVPAPADVQDMEVGRDRFRGQLFQMVFASEGICRVLIRLDDCHDKGGIVTPPPPSGPSGGDGIPGGTTGFARR